MNKLNDAISKALEGIRVDEGTLTPALQKALTCKNMQVKRECDKCGFKIPKYKGRYPKHCPECGDAVTDADKEVLASDEPQTEDPGIVNMGKFLPMHSHAQQHGGLAHGQMHLRGPIMEAASKSERMRFGKVLRRHIPAMNTHGHDLSEVRVIQNPSEIEKITKEKNGPDLLLVFDGAGYDFFSSYSSNPRLADNSFEDIEILAKKYGYRVEHGDSWYYSFYKEGMNEALRLRKPDEKFDPNIHFRDYEPKKYDDWLKEGWDQFLKETKTKNPKGWYEITADGVMKDLIPKRFFESFAKDTDGKFERDGYGNTKNIKFAADENIAQFDSTFKDKMKFFSGLTYKQLGRGVKNLAQEAIDRNAQLFSGKSKYPYVKLELHKINGKQVLDISAGLMGYNYYYVNDKKLAQEISEYITANNRKHTYYGTGTDD